MANRICQISRRLLARFVCSGGLPQAKRVDPRVTPSVLRHIITSGIHHSPQTWSGPRDRCNWL